MDDPRVEYNAWHTMAHKAIVVAGALADTDDVPSGCVEEFRKARATYEAIIEDRQEVEERRPEGRAP